MRGFGRSWFFSMAGARMMTWKIGRLVCGLLVCVGMTLATQTARGADEPKTDPIGAYQTTPTALSVPGYTTPDPEKATTKEVAIAVDKVAQSASRSYFSAN